MEKKENLDDRLLYIVVGIILVVAIAVVLIWVFTKNDKLESKDDDKKNPPVVEPEKDKDKKDDDVVVKPVEQVENEEKQEEIIVWTISGDLVLKSLVGKPILINTNVLVNGELKSAYVKVLREVSTDVWEEIIYYNNIFIPIASGNYRLVYKYNNEEKIHNFVIASEEVIKVSDNLINLDDNGLPFELAERFRVIIANQKMVSVNSVNDVHKIIVNGHLKEHEDVNDPLRYPIGLLVDLSGRVSNITTLTSPTQGVYVDGLNIETWGANLANGIVLVWLDAKEFINNDLTIIDLVINGVTYKLNIVINNWQIPEYVQAEVIDNEMIALVPEVDVNGTTDVAVLRVEKLIGNMWTEESLTNYEFTPILGETYRYVYTYEGEEKIVNLRVLEKFSIGNNSDKVADNLVNSGFESDERFDVIQENLGKISVILTGNNKFEITVNDHLVAFGDASRNLRIPLGLILDLTSEIDTITSIQSNTNGVYVDLDGTLPWGADTPNGEVLVWLDYNEFNFNTTYNVSLKLVGELNNAEIEVEKLFTIQLIDNRP